MTEIELNKIKEMPKAVLHLHLDGSLRPETVYKWLKEQGKDVTLEQVQKDLMVDKNCRDLNEYLQKFDLPLEVLQTEEHIEQATYELFEDLANQNVIYAEVRFAPSLHTEQGLQYNQIVEAAIRGMNKAKEKFGIDGNLILCCMRGEVQLNQELLDKYPDKFNNTCQEIVELIKNNQEVNENILEIFTKGKENVMEHIKTIATAYRYSQRCICSGDLAGAEKLYPTQNHKYIFEIMKKLGVPFTIHAGEADGPESIKEAVADEAERIGHGVRCFEEPALVGEIAQKEITLEICPTSNLQTNAVKDVYKVIEELYKRGVKITINTDNNTVSNTSIVEEYKNVLENTNLKIEDLIQMNINAIRGAFISPQKQTELISKISMREEDKDLQK